MVVSASESSIFNGLLDVVLKSSTVMVATSSIIIAFLVSRRRGKVRFGKLILDFEGKQADPASLLIDAEKSLEPAERQYLLLKAYHQQSLGQSQISMWFSLAFAAIGFAVIIVALFANSKNGLAAERIIKLVSGTVIDAVASLFFVQSNKSRELMATFFDKLRTDRKLDESLHLVSDVSDKLLQSRLQLLLALNFADVKVADGTLLSVMNVRADEKPNLLTPRPSRTPEADAKAGNGVAVV
jgi:hypothetical protein